MSNGKFQKYIIDVITLLKKQAIESKKDSDNPKEGFKDYAQGITMGYYSIINLLKHQAFAFCIDQKELGLADIKPDIDLLGLHRNPDIIFEEDNWATDDINEEKIKGYLSDSIKLLNEQAKEAKSDADKLNPEKDGYNQGHLMAYYSVFSLLKHKTFAFHIDEEELGLAHIDPDTDLLSLKKGQ